MSQIPTKIQKIFSSTEIKHGISLFTLQELNYVENLITEREGKFFIHDSIKIVSGQQGRKK